MPHDALRPIPDPASDTPAPPGWHAIEASQALQTLDSSATGLTPAEAAVRLATHGPNRLTAAARPGWLRRFAGQFNNVLIYVLLAAGFTTLWLEDVIDAAVIFGVVLINAVIGFIQEGKAERALEAVHAMLASHATVLRDGERHEIDAGDLVPGDVVLIESGTRVPADLRLLATKNLRIDEAALTGESLPVDKDSAPVAPLAPLAERTGMAYAGTVAAVGQGTGLVVATAAHTEIGRIGRMVSELQTLATPLTRRLDQFARQITFFILLVSVATFLWGSRVGGLPALDIFLAVVGLAVAAIPEGLPAIVTITLAIGTAAMAGQRAIVRRLPAVETLGSVGVICTDKTGTLTKNEMTAVGVMLPGDSLTVSGAGYAPEGGFHADGRPVATDCHTELLGLARCALLCNDAQLHRDAAGRWTLAGDPTEGALLTLALKAGLDLGEETARTPRTDSLPFESENRYMATLHHDHQGRVFALLKGGPERVLGLCVRDAAGLPLDAAAWQARMDGAASQGQRVLALAECELPAGTSELTLEHITPRFTLLGLVGLMDPPRPEAVAAVAECQQAGVRVLMITGDHATTAAAIGASLGLRDGNPITGAEIDTLDDAALGARLAQTDVIARASPEHKLRLVANLQAGGQLVAMTGDGVNDAPALKAADIGVAMGQRGTDAAREAADLVLTDDNFATIAHAVREGRRVFDNIKKSLLFILPTNGGEAGLILIAVFAGLALPVTAGQILWVNMVTSITLDMALAFEPAEDGVMRRPPRPASEPLITRLLFVRIAYITVLMVAATFVVYGWELSRGHSIEVARTAVVNMLVMSEIFYLFNVRHFTASAFRWETLAGNRIAVWACVITLGLQALFTYAPPMQALFGTAPLDAWSWLLITALASAKFVVVEIEKAVLRRMGIQRM
ncbi:MAG: HAD-IC family P-type ATPase [Gammaproteobacteria bacterium]|uniref:cation-translocating P-type ATPase n=1 Tax=Hydrogenophaga sp. TaxID=1904254 RepID=UPI0025C5E901|nr:HAD-IC family P-type ATPase [Hydrogenophaga sp.]MBU4181595.1 HAD-IC family P-type ATPase [Gammaproteobacteria bacterium]MBU4280950.1 HAD-IC family P-type ATPase [Gammaproteobacteria bacterium]MBU4324039.1 HAD-IC family P-type ATPase [Gammaproteobacteria bacterium]MCG2656742.1 HAD-IC family P-type ATPase [Hydrogenophaga sp.]